QTTCILECGGLSCALRAKGLTPACHGVHAKHSAPALAKRKHHASPYNRCSMRHKVTLIAGEGIGPEVAAATRRIIEASGVLIDWEAIEGRPDKSNDQGQLLNQAGVEAVRRNHVALKGP